MSAIVYQGGCTQGRVVYQGGYMVGGIPGWVPYPCYIPAISLLDTSLSPCSVPTLKVLTCVKAWFDKVSY